MNVNQWTCQLTGSTQQAVSDLNPLNQLNIIGASHCLIPQPRDFRLPPDNKDKIETIPVPSWDQPQVNYSYNYFASTSLLAQTATVTCDEDAAKILIVDDHPASRIAAAAVLAIEGYKVMEADSGSAALKLIAQSQPDLILLDVMMPGMDGFEVCTLLKQDQQTRLIPVIFITALNDKRSRIRGIEAGGDDFLSKPFDRVELAARVQSLVRQKRLNEDLDHAEQVLFSIARAIESRDPNTGDHCERLSQLGKAFGEYLCLSRTALRDLMWGGYLHDIGKVGIPDGVLLKCGKLTEDEWKTMMQHVLIGERICQPLRTMRGVIPIIRHHHERWDGSGYPDGLKQEEIPYLAQVFQIIDIYDALTSERPYKVAFTPTEAIAILKAEVEKGWRNPKLVEQFQEFIATYELD
jgi:putative two-component system response regulator